MITLHADVHDSVLLNDVFNVTEWAVCEEVLFICHVLLFKSVIVYLLQCAVCTEYLNGCVSVFVAERVCVCAISKTFLKLVPSRTHIYGST